MAFADVAGRAGFIIDVDKSAVDTKLPQAERQFQSSYSSMARSTDVLAKSSQTYTQQVIAESRARIADLRDAKARSLVAQAQARANDELTGSFTRLSDRQTVVAKSGRDATQALGTGRGVGLAGSLGLIGVGAAVGIQALNEVSSALRVTGAEATTTEGRFRNVGAELSQGNVIGAFKAVRTEVMLTGEMLAKLVANSEKAGDQTEIDGLRATAAASGWEDLAKQLDAVSAAATAAASQRALDFSARTSNVVDTPSGSIPVTRGATPDDRGGPRGVGATGKGLSPTPFVDPFAARQRRAQDAVVSASMTRELGDDLKAQREIVAVAKARLAGAKKGTDDWRALQSAYAQELQRRQAIEDQIHAQEDRAAAEAQRKRDEAARKAQAARDKAARQREKEAREAKAARDRAAAIQQRAQDQIARDNTRTRANLIYDPISGFFESTKPKGGTAADAGAITAAQIAASIKEALSAERLVLQRYSGNFQTAKLETHGYEAVQEARMTRAAIEEMSRRGGFPASAYSQASAAAAGA